MKRILVILLILPGLLFADSVFVSKVKGVSKFHRFKINKYQNQENYVKLDKALTLRAAVKGMGKVRVKLTHVKGKTWESYRTVNGVQVLENTKQVFFKGTLKKGKSSYPVSASLFKLESGSKFLRVAFNYVDSQLNREAFTIRIKTGKNDQAAKHSVSRLNRYALTNHKCGVEHEDYVAPMSSNPPTAPMTIQTLELSTDADSVWHDQFGTSSNSEIASIVNDAEVIYEDQIFITFEIVKQNVFDDANDDPYVAISAAETLLEKIKDYTIDKKHLGSADVYHLFTGKDMDGSTIGIAYVGVICKEIEFSFGVNQFFQSSDLTMVIFAHELGHNFSAQHVGSGIMTTSLDPSDPPDDFADESVTQMTDHVNDHGSNCLDKDGDDNPQLPDPDDDDDDDDDGGGGGGSDPDSTPVPVPGIQLTTSGDKAGNITITIALDYTDATCRVDLRASVNPKSKSAGGSLLTSYTATELTRTFTINFPKRVKRTRRNTSGRVFVNAGVHCTGSFAHDSARLKPKRGNRIAPKRWIKRFARKF